MKKLEKELRGKRTVKECDHRQTRSLVQSAGRKKSALILAVSYSSSDNHETLRNAISDAETLQKTLFDQGWSVETEKNRGLETKEKIKERIKIFAETHGDDDVMIAFFGHGVEVNDRNYLVAANSEIGNHPDEAAYEEAVKLECLAFEDVKGVFKDARDEKGSSAAPPAIVFLLDKCCATGKGFALNSSTILARNPRIITLTNSIALFSTSSGNLAYDGNNKGGAFMGIFCEQIVKSCAAGFGVYEVMDSTRKRLRDAWDSCQLPEMRHPNLLDDFFFSARRKQQVFPPPLSHMAPPIQRAAS